MTAAVSPSNSVVGLPPALVSSPAPQSQGGFAKMLQEQNSVASQSAHATQKSPEQTSSVSGKSSTNGLPNAQQKKPPANDAREQQAKSAEGPSEVASDRPSLDPADTSAARAKRSRANAAEKKAAAATPTTESTAVAHMPQQGMMNLLMLATTWTASSAKASSDKTEPEPQDALSGLGSSRAGSSMVLDGAEMLSAGMSKGDTQAEAGGSKQPTDAKASVEQLLLPVNGPREGEHEGQGLPDHATLRKSGHVEGTQRAELAAGQGVDGSAAEQGRRGLDRSHTSKASDAAGHGLVATRQVEGTALAPAQQTVNLQVPSSAGEQSLAPDKSSLSVQGGGGQAKLNEMRRGVERLQTTGAAEAQLNVALSTRPTEIPLHVESLVLATPVNSPEFPRDLGAQVSLMVRDGVQHAELQVHPAELGPISIQISLDGTNARVDFSADSAVTRQVIESGLHELAAALRDAGFTLSGGGVHQQSRGQRDGDNTSGKQGGGGQPGTIDRLEAGGDELRANARMSTGGVDLYA